MTALGSVRLGWEHRAASPVMGEFLDEVLLGLPVQDWRQGTTVQVAADRLAGASGEVLDAVGVRHRIDSIHARIFG